MIVFMVASLKSLYTPNLYRGGWRNVAFSLVFISVLGLANIVLTFWLPDWSGFWKIGLDFVIVAAGRYFLSINPNFKEVMKSVVWTTLTTCSALLALDSLYSQNAEYLAGIVFLFVVILGWLALVLVLTLIYFRLRNLYLSLREAGSFLELFRNT